jgi:excisionase family DNA binding protein
VLTEEQAAEFLKRSRSWVRTKAQEGKIPRYADGGESRYYVYDLFDYILRGE